MISKEAKYVETIFRCLGMRKVFSKMILKPKRKPHLKKPPKRVFKKYRLESSEISGQNCYSLKRTENTKKHIIYFHGGAYALQAQRIHWKIIEHLLDKTNYEITLVNYPLVPEYTCSETIAIAGEVYSSLRKIKDKETILIGDSSGGGLALALAQYIKAKGLQPKPEKIVLFSPWLDVSMANDFSKEQEEKDLLLSKETLIAAGKRYAGECDMKDYRCSPLYGDITQLGEIALFVGTSEILHNQAMELRDKFQSYGQSISFFEYEQMQHVWVGFPIPEAKKALDEAIAFIKR